MERQNKITLAVILIIGICVTFLSVSSGSQINNTTIENATGQSFAPYTTCIIFSDNGYEVIVQQDVDCNYKQFSETVLYYQTLGYQVIGYSNKTAAQTMYLER